VSSRSCGLDMSLIAYALQLPDLMTLAQEVTIIDPDRLHAAKTHVQESLARSLYQEFFDTYNDNRGTGTILIYTCCIRSLVMGMSALCRRVRVFAD
jgi:hypothetical protein